MPEFENPTLSAPSADPTPPAPPAGRVVLSAEDALNRAVMIATRREGNYAPAQVTLGVCTAAGVWAAEAHRHDERGYPAPDRPDLVLPLYTVTHTEWAALTAAYTAATAAGSGLVLTVTAPVPDWHIPHGYVWSWDRRTGRFEPVESARARGCFDQDTKVFTFHLHCARYPSVPALSPISPETPER